MEEDFLIIWIIAKKYSGKLKFECGCELFSMVPSSCLLLSFDLFHLVSYKTLNPIEEPGDIFKPLNFNQNSYMPFWVKFCFYNVLGKKNYNIYFQVKIFANSGKPSALQ